MAFKRDNDSLVLITEGARLFFYIKINVQPLQAFCSREISISRRGWLRRELKTVAMVKRKEKKKDHCFDFHFSFISLICFSVL